MKRNLYQILGVHRKAGEAEIAAAWKAVENDPAAGQDPSLRVAAREAYQILSNPQQRAAYDASLVAAARRALSTSGTDEPHPEDAEESPLRRLVEWPGFKIALAAVVVAVAVGIWQWRKPPRESAAPRPGGTVVSREVIVLSPQPGQVAVPADRQSAAPAAVSRTRGAEEIFSAVSPSVALVTIGGATSGSGVVTGSQTVVTNCHVVNRPGDLRVKVGGRLHDASVSVSDREFDLCRLSVPGLDAPAVPVGRVGDLRVGQKVYAVGAPQGLELSLTDGIVSALREVPGGTVIQTSTPVSPGSSGGGLFDSDGRLVGIVTFQHRYGQNLNFAVPADWITEMRERGGRERAPAAIASSGAERSPATPAAQMRGRWSCFGVHSGINGEWEFGTDGTISITRAGGAGTARASYTVQGKVLRMTDGKQTWQLEIESVTEERAVLNAGGGNRVVCDRR